MNVSDKPDGAFVAHIRNLVNIQIESDLDEKRLDTQFAQALRSCIAVHDEFIHSLLIEKLFSAGKGNES